MKKLLFSLAALALFVGCSKDVDQSGFTAQDLQGNAFLSIGLVNGGVGTRANGSDPGSLEESEVKKVTVLLFDELNTCLGTIDFPGTTVGGGSGSGNPAATPSEPQLVSAETKKIFVVINPNAGWDFTTAKGKAWSAINTAIDVAIGSVAANNNFVMTSAGTLANGALTNVTVYKAASESTADVDAAKAAAKNGAATVKIDRMAAKIRVAENTNGVTAPAGTTFTFLGWELSVTNKSVKLYSDIVSYPDATPSVVPGIYRMDKNYLTSEQPDFTKPVEMKAAFDYLTNDPLSMPPVARLNGEEAYCLENTMEAVAQKLGVTTKVVVRAEYTPKDLTVKASYFMWNGDSYTLATLQAAYASHAAGTGLKADLPIFLKKAGIYADADGDIDTFVANLTADKFTATSGIAGRYCAVRYYHESVCYYDVLVRHDQNVTTDMALGRYGVVRNNWYSLSIDKVSGPGTPWIPDPSDPDPTNPTVPDTDDDKGNAYLSVTMTINPWTFWTQGVELN